MQEQILKKHIQSLRKKFINRCLAIELTNACNLKCPLCSTGSGFDTKPKGMMNFSDFERFMEQCAPVLDSVDLIGSGEPFLHPELTRFFSCASKKHKKFTACCTNGTVPKDPGEIIDSGLHVLYINIEGLTQEQHEKYRVGSNLKDILIYIESLVREKERRRSFYPEIYVNTVLSRYNEEDYDGLISLAKKLGVNGIRFTGIMDDIYQKTDWSPRLKKFQPVKRTGKLTCSFSDTMCGILSWDGTVQLCCMSPHHKNPAIELNVFRKEQLLEILNSEEYYKTVKKAGHYAFCDSCFYCRYWNYCRMVVFNKSWRYYFRKLKKSPKALFQASCNLLLQSFNRIGLISRIKKNSTKG